MLKKWGVLILGAVTGAAVLIAGANAVTAPITTPSVDLSSKAAVMKYLAKHGIDSKKIVIQRGARNYAGPRCPGKGWNCTTSKRVVQISYGLDLCCEKITIREELPKFTDILIHAIRVEWFPRFRDFLQQIFRRHTGPFKCHVRQGSLVFRPCRFWQIGAAAPLQIMAKFQSEVVVIRTIDSSNEEVLDRLI